MAINALIMDETDNVATLVNDVAKGDEVQYKLGEELQSLVAEEDVPYCH